MPPHFMVPPGFAAPFGGMGGGMPPPGMGMPPPGMGMPGMMGGPSQGMAQGPSMMPLGGPGQQQPPAAAAAPGPGAAGPAAAGGKPQSEWTEHTAQDGRKYFFNLKLGKSSWERPEELMSEKEKTDSSGTAWKEFTSPDGRKYYYNKVTKESKWVMPEEMKKSIDDAAKKSGAGTVQVVGLPAAGEVKPTASPASRPAGQVAPAASVKEEVTSTSSKAAVSTGPVEYATKAEAKEAFKELLSSVNCASEWTWEQAMRLIVNDHRYGALKGLGEKKQCFNEFIQHKRNEEKEDERRRAKQAKDDFVRMIIDSTALKTSHSFKKAKEMFEEDSRWKTVPEREREELFHEAQMDKRNKEKEEQRADKKRRLAAYRELLERTPGIKMGSEWRKAMPKLEGEPEFETLDKMERLEGFQLYMAELERREREEREKEKEDVKRVERKAREAFHDLLQRHREMGLITVKTRWKEYAPAIKSEDAYLVVERNANGSRPKELFADLIEGMEVEFEKNKGLLRDVLKEAEVVVTSSSTYEDVLGPMEDKAADKLGKIDSNFKRAWFEELHGRARAEEEAAEGRRKRARERFASFLRHVRGMGPTTEWEQFEKDNEKDKEFKDVGPEAARQMFDEYQGKLRERAAAKELERAERDARDKERDEEREKRKRREASSDDEGGARGDKHSKKSSKSSKKSKSSRHDRRSDDEDEDRSKSSKKKHKSSRDKDRDSHDRDDGRDDDRKDKDKDGDRRDGKSEGREEGEQAADTDKKAAPNNDSGSE